MSQKWKLWLNECLQKIKLEKVYVRHFVSLVSLSKRLLLQLQQILLNLQIHPKVSIVPALAKISFVVSARKKKRFVKNKLLSQMK
jgi:hypothetical protein